LKGNSVVICGCLVGFGFWGGGPHGGQKKLKGDMITGAVTKIKKGRHLRVGGEERKQTIQPKLAVKRKMKNVQKKPKAPPRGRGQNKNQQPSPIHPDGEKSQKV